MTIPYKRLLAFLALGLLFALGARPAVGQTALTGQFSAEQLAALEEAGFGFDPELSGTPTISWEQYRSIMDNGGLSYWAGSSTQPQAQADGAALTEEMVSVSIRLNKAPLNIETRRTLQGAAAAYSEQLLYQMDFVNTRDSQSASVKALVESLGGTYVAEIRYLMSAILAEVPASAVPALQAHPHVVAVNPVADVERNLSETVPFIGAETLQLAGIDGTGVKVGVLDSGIDYTHAAFGGPGTVAFYENNAYYGPLAVCPTGLEPECYFNQDPATLGLNSLFGPLSVTGVRGGYDFVGENWPFSDLEPDPNPIDFEGHGTHVADIIGGNDGVAPGVDLYGYKVCSAVSSSCSGLAILQGLTQAYIDGMDIVNLSLGALYGQPNDDATFLVNQMAQGGVLAVISAGNSGDSPFIVGSPSSSSGAISVAQLTVPSAVLPKLTVQNTVGDPTAVDFTNVAFQDWSVYPTSAITSPLVYGNGNGTNLNGCAAFTADLTGQIVLIDRGVCSFSIKAANATAAGADAAIIGLIDASDPFAGGYGGGTVTIPSFMITQANSNTIKSRITAGSAPTMTIDPATFINNAYAVVGSSSRGPRNHDTFLKPEIGAPGASISAIAGSGDDTGAFGGTSGAAPMVSGAAALLIEHFNINEGEGFDPLDLKALMMIHANPNIEMSQLTGELAPVSRIGGGQVSVGNAATWTLLAYDVTPGVDPLMRTGALSLGYLPVSDDAAVVTRTLRVENFGGSAVTVEPVPTFRFASDAAAGALTPVVSPTSASIPAGDYVDFTFTFTLDAAALETAFDPLGFPTRGEGDATGGPVLTTYELDGYVELQDGSSNVLATVPWHVLPKAVTDIGVVDQGVTAGVGTIDFTNDGDTASTDDLELFRLFEENPSWGLVVADCASMGLAPGCNYEGVDIKHVGYSDSPGAFGGAGLLLFAVSTYDLRASQFPGTFEVYMDTDQDGVADYVTINNDLNLLTGAAGINGENWFATFDLNTGGGALLFKNTAAMNSTVTVMPALNLEFAFGSYDMGLSVGDAFDWWVAAFDNYNGGYFDCAPNVPGLTRPFDDGETDCAAATFTATYGEWVFEPSDLYPEPTVGGPAVSINYAIGALGGSDTGILMVNYAGHTAEETIAIPLDVADFLTNKVFLPWLSTTP